MDPNTDAPRLTDGHDRVLRAADTFFGGFCMLMLAVTGLAWHQGSATAFDFLFVLGFLIANVILSQVSLRTRHPYRVEVARVVVGGIVAPAAYLGVGGPIAPWWPGFLIMGLGGAIVLGLLTQRPFWGRVLVVYYIGLLAISAALSPAGTDWYQFTVGAGVIAMVGLMFAQIMSMLGATLHQEYERTLELKSARDALFAEVEVAQEIQTLLLPREPTMTDHLVHGRMVTATEVGGDYYDVIETRGRSLLAIGDVSGHGVTSGLTMMMARTSLVGALESNPTSGLGPLYQVLNRCIRLNLERMGLSMYMTFALLEYDGDGRFTAVGRHVPLLIYRAATREIEEIDLEGMWLGVVDELPDPNLTVERFRLSPGDLLFLYTDGIVEQYAGAEMFGFERLKEAVRNNAPSGATGVVDGVLAALRGFSSEQDDDITILAVDHRGSLGEAPHVVPLSA